MTTETSETKGNQGDGTVTTITNNSPTATTPTTGWVHFEEDTSAPVTPPAVISAESVQVNLERSTSSSNNNAVAAVSDGGIATLDPKPLRTVRLQVETVRQGFCKC